LRNNYGCLIDFEPKISEVSCFNFGLAYFLMHH